VTDSAAEVRRVSARGGCLRGAHRANKPDGGHADLQWTQWQHQHPARTAACQLPVGRT